MTLKYSENRIKEAIRLNDGNTVKARQQVMAWLFEDHKLLLDITRPHITGIVAYAVNRALSHMNQTEEERLEETAEEAARAVDRKKDKASLGQEILKGYATKSGTQFGQEATGVPLQKKAASQGHIDTIHMLAAQSKKKLSDND